MNGAAGIRCFGPTKAAARMEGSKTFSKDFMARHGIPTARFKNFRDYDRARKFLDAVSYNVCIKANGRELYIRLIVPIFIMFCRPETVSAFWDVSFDSRTILQEKY